MEIEFNKYTHCARCKRYIDEETVRLKKVIVGPDTYRQSDSKYLESVKYEKICSDCHNKR